MAKVYVKFEVPKDLNDKVLQLVEIAKNTGKLRKGTNETTKAVEKGNAQIVVIAQDVDPEEIVMHLPALCDEKKVPYIYVSRKTDLGRSAGLDVGCAAIAVAEAGEGKDLLKEITKSVEQLQAKA